MKTTNGQQSFSWPWATWVVVGLAVAAAIALRDLGSLLASIPGHRSFSPDVFTGFDPTPWTHEIDKALSVWQTDLRYHWWVNAHLLIDLFIFAPTYCWLLYRVLRQVGVTVRAWTGAIVVFVADATETISTLIVINSNGAGAWAIPYLSGLKWLALIAVLIVVFISWVQPQPQPTQEWSAQRFGRAIAKTWRGDQQAPISALRGQLVVLGFFLALIALPADGPLEQLPDVLRAQLPFRLVLVFSVVSVILFVVALAISGWRATSPSERPSTGRAERELKWWEVLVPAIVFGLSVWLLNVILECKLDRWVSFAVPLTILALILADCAWRGMKPPQRNPARRRHCITPHLRPRGGVGPADRPAPAELLWIGGLAGAAVVGAGLGMLRATIRPLTLEPEYPRWLVWTAIGVMICVAGGWATQWVINWFLHGNRADWKWTTLSVACYTLVAVAVVSLALDPSLARLVGTNGVIALCGAALVLIIGEIQRLSRTRPVWGVTKRLGLGSRTPWLAMLIAAWLLTSPLNTEGGYHDARVEVDKQLNRYENPVDAWTKWKEAALKQPGCVENGRVRMVMVAAPGGGIRAAYWTASALDALITADPCGRTRLFAISSVSGGSLGATTWLGSAPGQAQATMDKLSRDQALAAAAAALFTRDLLQPFVGLTDSWRDRAEIMEDAWAADAPFGTPDKPLLLSELGADKPLLLSELGADKGWVPAVVLNGSSVTDGCRVLMTNVASLPTDRSDCRAAPGSLASPLGPVTGSLDVLDGLQEKLEDDGDPCTRQHDADLRAVTATLLSARFPFVSPSATLKRCINNEVQTTYDVDGGYYENSGLLTLLQLWKHIESSVRAFNANDQKSVEVDPWIVILGNDYRSSSEPPPVERQYELSIPLATLGQARGTLDEEKLEQAASVAMSEFGRSGCFSRIGPARRPSVPAPLGWVLSDSTRADLKEHLKDERSHLEDVFGYPRNPCESPAQKWLRWADLIVASIRR